MPWTEVNRMSLRKEFVMLAQNDSVDISELCRRFGISRKTGYKWLKRYREGGEANLKDRSRQPTRCPHQTPSTMEKKVVELRKRKSAWGGRKIRAHLLQKGHKGVPAASTITEILRRKKQLDPQESQKHQACCRFEKETPNELWQMDFKGDFPTLEKRCYPLTLLDDCSRFALGLFSCANQQRDTVQSCLERVFQHGGMPHAMLMDNGPPWGGGETCEYTRITVWLMRLGIRVYHGRPYHPQTQGKVERFHRTFKVELVQRESFVDLAHCQRRFDQWREEYNYERPHEALDLATPGSRYHPSSLSYPAHLPPIEYETGALVRKVQHGGRIAFHCREYRVGHAFVGLPVALKPSAVDGVMEVYFCQHLIKMLDLRGEET